MLGSSTAGRSTTDGKDPYVLLGGTNQPAKPCFTHSFNSGSALEERSEMDPLFQSWQEHHLAAP